MSNDELLNNLAIQQSNAYKNGYRQAINLAVLVIKNNRQTYNGETCNCRLCNKVDIILDELKEMAAEKLAINELLKILGTIQCEREQK